MPRFALLSLLTLFVFTPPLRAADPLPLIPRVLPPVGIVLPAKQKQVLYAKVEQLEKEMAEFDPRIENRDRENMKYRYFADVAIFPKAVRYALDYDEFYQKSDAAEAEKLLEMGRQRLAELKKGGPEAEDNAIGSLLFMTNLSWRKQKGLVVRGYLSSLDNSVQPYGVYVPESLETTKDKPLYVWLHGRNEKGTDMQFLFERMKSKGKFALEDGVTVHPFGRYCNAFKFMGENDVHAATSAAFNEYQTDFFKQVLMGFSMGGAGCWHLAARDPLRYCAAAPGAGFVESRIFLGIRDDQLPPWYEQKLWSWYDVPGYTQNLFNIPVIAYSGEKDKQKQAADIMEAEYAKYGKKLNYVIGKGMGHDYDQASLEQIAAFVQQVHQQPRPIVTMEMDYQSAKIGLTSSSFIGAIPFFGARIVAHHEEWSPNEAHFKITGDTKNQTITFTTKNIRMLATKGNGDVIINGHKFANDPDSAGFELSLDQQTITPLKTKEWHAKSKQLKHEQLSGTIDDAFCGGGRPVLFVKPTGKSKHPAIQAWVEHEMQYQIDRWRRCFRGDLPVKNDNEVTVQDIKSKNLILWGDPDSNSLSKKYAAQFPIGWNAEQISAGEAKYDVAKHVPVGIYPNPDSHFTYFVLNSGPTFRDEHDRNNANQTPKLPDWAVIDVTTPADGKSPGRVVNAGFFDNNWKFVDPAKQQADWEKRAKE